MVKVYERECIQNYFLEAENGDRAELREGKTYTVSAVNDGKVTVFSDFWFPAPENCFAPPRLRTEKDKP